MSRESMPGVPPGAGVVSFLAPFPFGCPECGRLLAEKFTLERYTAEIMKLYNGVIAEKQKELTGR